MNTRWSAENTCSHNGNVEPVRPCTTNHPISGQKRSASAAFEFDSRLGKKKSVPEVLHSHEGEVHSSLSVNIVHNIEAGIDQAQGEIKLTFSSTVNAKATGDGMYVEHSNNTSNKTGKNSIVNTDGSNTNDVKHGIGFDSRVEYETSGKCYVNPGSLTVQEPLVQDWCYPLHGEKDRTYEQYQGLAVPEPTPAGYHQPFPARPRSSYQSYASPGRLPSGPPFSAEVHPGYPNIGGRAVIGETGPAAETLKQMAAQHRHQEKTIQQYSLYEDTARGRFIQHPTKPLSHLPSAAPGPYYFNPQGRVVSMAEESRHHFADQGVYVRQQMQHRFQQQQQQHLPSHPPLPPPIPPPPPLHLHHHHHHHHHNHQQQSQTPHQHVPQHFVQHQHVSNVRWRTGDACPCSGDRKQMGFYQPQQNNSYYQVTRHQTTRLYQNFQQPAPGQCFPMVIQSPYEGSQSHLTSLTSYPFPDGQQQFRDASSGFSALRDEQSLATKLQTGFPQPRPYSEQPSSDHEREMAKTEKSAVAESSAKSLHLNSNASPSSSSSFSSSSSSSVTSTASKSVPSQKNQFSKGQTWVSFQSAQQSKPSAQIHPFVASENQRKGDSLAAAPFASSHSEKNRFQESEVPPSLLDEPYEVDDSPSCCAIQPTPSSSSSSALSTFNLCDSLLLDEATHFAGGSLCENFYDDVLTS